MPIFAARSAPLMRGLKLGIIQQLLGNVAKRRAVCPANEGIETQCDHFRNPLLGPAARSAPLMRGLKLGCFKAQTSGDQSRAVCPANEGIETWKFLIFFGFGIFSRAVCPANEGIETCVRYCLSKLVQNKPRGLPR